MLLYSSVIQKQEVKVKAKTKFMKMFNKLPKEARRELVYHYWDNPMSLNVIAIEIKMNTKLGKKILKDLGYENGD